MLAGLAAVVAAWTGLMLPGFDRVRTAVLLPPAAVAYARAGDTTALARALARGADPNATRRGIPAVAYAAGEGQRAALRVLLAHGADPNRPATRYEVPPLSAAVVADDSAAVGLLVAAGARAEQESLWGHSPLFTAVDHRRPAALVKLLAVGANPNASAHGGLSPLALSLLRGDTVLANALLAGGASMDAPMGGYRTTPRLLAADSPAAWLRAYVARHPRARR